MPQTTAELVDLLSLEPDTDQILVGKAPKTIMQRTYGGQVLAQGLMAAYHTVPKDRFAHSLHGYFLRSGQALEPINYEVDVMRDGTTFSSRDIRATQNKLILEMSASFHLLEQSPLDHQDSIPQGLPKPQDCPSFFDVMNERFGEMKIWSEWNALDVRFAGDSNEQGYELGSNHHARMSVWVKTQDELPDDPRIHQAVLAYLSDLTLLSVSALPHKVVFLSSQVQTASVDHSIWYHRKCRADHWLLYDQVSPSASNALGFSMGRLFQDGNLVASCAQEGLVRKVEHRPILT